MCTREDDDGEEAHYRFQEYLFEQKEWLEYEESGKGSKGSRVIRSQPFLLMELSRLVPYLENDRVQFHPLNLPNLKMGIIEIAAQVVEVWEDGKFLRLTVEDSTGSLCVLYERNRYDADLNLRQTINAKYRLQAATLRNQTVDSGQRHRSTRGYPDPRPGFEYPAETSPWDIAELEQDWWVDTKKGMLGKRIAALDHVHAIGYYMFDQPSECKPKSEIDFQDVRLAKTSFFAVRLDIVRETEYNDLLQTWIRTAVRDRYCDKSAQIAEPGCKTRPHLLVRPTTEGEEKILLGKSRWADLADRIERIKRQTPSAGSLTSLS